MAERSTIDGETYKKRSPVGVWLLTAVTLLVYWFVWYYKVNDEARRYLRDDSIKPWRCVLAQFPGVLILVPFLVSLHNTGRRIERIEVKSGSAKRVRPALGPVLGFLTLLTLLFMGGCLFYFQGHLNAAWSAAEDRTDHRVGMTSGAAG